MRGRAGAVQHRTTERHDGHSGSKDRMQSPTVRRMGGVKGGEFMVGGILDSSSGWAKKGRRY